MSIHRWLILGGAGFIGSHFVDTLLDQGQRVVVIDNFSSGTRHHLEHHVNSKFLEVIELDIENTQALKDVFNSGDYVLHLASNPDIARAQTDPRVDFLQGTILTESVCEASRLKNVKKIIYASGSGVYKEDASLVHSEDSKMEPISTYGASKLAGEALLAAYSHMFGLEVSVFRFANVVGPRQTHGVAFDFIRKLRRNNRLLEIQGNGKQQKSYIFVKDVVSGVLLASTKQNSRFDIYNISTVDTLLVEQIASLVIEGMRLDFENVEIKFGENDRGWKGDVPKVRMDSSKLRKLGWEPQFNSLEAMKESIPFLIAES